MAILNKPGKIILDANELAKLLNLIMNAVYPNKTTMEVKDIATLCEYINNNVEYLETKIEEVKNEN